MRPLAILALLLMAGCGKGAPAQRAVEEEWNDRDYTKQYPSAYEMAAMIQITRDHTKAECDSAAHKDSLLACGHWPEDISLVGISDAPHWRTVATTNREQHVITIEFLCPGPASPSYADENARWICRNMAAAAPRDHFHWDAVRCDYDGIATYEMVAPLPEKPK